MLRCVACWDLNTGLSGAGFSIFVPTKLFFPDPRVTILPFFCRTLLFQNLSPALDTLPIEDLSHQAHCWCEVFKVSQKRKTRGKKTNKKNDVLIEAVRDMKMDLGSAFPKPQHFSLDPKFSRIFPPHNHVYSNCSIWHLLSWLINYASPKNDPVGWDFDPTWNSRSFEEEARLIPVQGILAEAGRPIIAATLSTPLLSRTPVAPGIKRKWRQVWEGLQQDSFLSVTGILTGQTFPFLPPTPWRSIWTLYVSIHAVFINKPFPIGTLNISS